MKQTIQNKDGDTKECEAVDAREHIASGRWFEAVDEIIPEPVVDLKEDAKRREKEFKQAVKQKTGK